MKKTLLSILAVLIMAGIIVGLGLILPTLPV